MWPFIIVTTITQEQGKLLFLPGLVFAKDKCPRLPTIVTASVDKLDLIPKEIDPVRDIKLTGCVAAVGKTSMEIQIDAFQEDLHGGWENILTTYFTMVARDPVTNKPHPINRLVSKTDKDEQMRLIGEKNKQER